MAHNGSGQVLVPCPQGLDGPLRDRDHTTDATVCNPSKHSLIPAPRALEAPFRGTFEWVFQ
jgi:hypothetical protein